MHQEKQILYIVVEKQYSHTSWYARLSEGIYKEASKRPIKIQFCSDAELSRLSPGSILVLLGSSYPFVMEYVELCKKLELRPIIAGLESIENDMPVSYITINRRQSMFDVVKALISCGARRVALLGVNSSIQTDMLRYAGYSDAVLAYCAGNPKEDVFYSDDGLPSCMEQFWKNYQKYDAVACANDYYAANLCYEAKQRGIRIPEDMMVTGFGNTKISQFTEPTLTTVALNLTSIGEQVIAMYRLLSKNPDLLSCTFMLKSEIIFRKSTRKEHIDLTNQPVLTRDNFSALEPTFEKHLKSIYALEQTLAAIDSVDTKIIRGILDGLSYNALSEKLFLSDTAFKYRLYKMFASTGCQNRKELASLFTNYVPLFRDDHF